MIHRLSMLSGAERADALSALERIFFASSLRKNFADAAARAAFLATWTGWYLREAPQDVFCARDPASGAWTGYLTGCRDSAGAGGLFAAVPFYDRFADLFDAFPAHLHVNIDENRRNQGIGAALIEAFAAECGAEAGQTENDGDESNGAGCAGLHVVTGTAARNRAFYRRCGFTYEVERGGLLFMGRRRSSARPVS